MKTPANKALTLFTPREHEVIHLICEQYTTPEIAMKLDLSERTVEGFRAAILKKIKARNSAGIVVFAVRNKMFTVN